jgi:hypothetical protein
MRSIPLAAACAAVLAILPGCSSTTSKEFDTDSPAAPESLSVVAISDSVAILTWKAPGDDGSTGQAAAYDVRHAASASGLAAWGTALQAAGEPTPGPVGTVERFVLSGLTLGEEHYFAVKALDEEGNASEMSNPSATDGYFAPTTIAGAIHDLQRAYNQRDQDHYAGLLADDFLYLFAPQDVGGSGGIPDSWGRVDEIESANAIFSGEPNAEGFRCEAVSLGFLPGSDGPSPIEDWRMATLSQIQLAVDTRHADSGEPLRYELYGDRADLHFVRTVEIEPVSGERIWKIIQWEDKPAATRLSTDPTTWGRIKALWR